MVHPRTASADRASCAQESGRYRRSRPSLDGGTGSCESARKVRAWRGAVGLGDGARGMAVEASRVAVRKGLGIPAWTDPVGRAWIGRPGVARSCEKWRGGLGRADQGMTRSDGAWSGGLGEDRRGTTGCGPTRRGGLGRVCHGGPVLVRTGGIRLLWQVSAGIGSSGCGRVRMGGQGLFGPGEGTCGAADKARTGWDRRGSARKGRQGAAWSGMGRSGATWWGAADKAGRGTKGQVWKRSGAPWRELARTGWHGNTVARGSSASTSGN